MDYISQVQQLLNKIVTHEQASIERAAEAIVHAIDNGGIVQLYGSGHSSLLAQELHFRAGGIVPVKPISIEPLMLHQGAVTSSNNEKNEQLVDAYWQEVHLQPNDVFFVISTSGRNPVPIEFAKRAQQLGVTVISLQSLAYNEQTSRHSSGHRLEHFAHIILNTHVPLGDGVLNLETLQFGPVSTIAGATILNEIIVRVIQKLHKAGKALPVFGSSNIEGQGNSNDYWIDQYKNRIDFN